MAAITRSDIANERLFAFAHPWNTNLILQTLRKPYPERKFHPNIPGLPNDKNTILPVIRAEQILKEMGRAGWTSLDESLRMNTETITS